MTSRQEIDGGIFAGSRGDGLRLKEVEEVADGGIDRWGRWDGSHDDFTSMRGNTEEWFVPARSCMSFKEKQATSNRIGGLLLGLESYNQPESAFPERGSVRPSWDQPRFQCVQWLF